MDLRAMLAASLAESMLDGGGETPHARPDVRAQRLELLARFARYHERHEFRPGDLVAEKEGIGTLSHVRGEPAAMFWRPLVPADPADALIVAKAIKDTRVNRVDCIVAIVDTANDGTSSVVFVPHEAACLRPLTAEERAELDAARGEGP